MWVPEGGGNKEGRRTQAIGSRILRSGAVSRVRGNVPLATTSRRDCLPAPQTKLEPRQSAREWTGDERSLRRRVVAQNRSARERTVRPGRPPWWTGGRSQAPGLKPPVWVAVPARRPSDTPLSSSFPIVRLCTSLLSEPKCKRSANASHRVRKRLGGLHCRRANLPRRRSGVRKVPIGPPTRTIRTPLRSASTRTFRSLGSYVRFRPRLS